MVNRRVNKSAKLVKHGKNVTNTKQGNKRAGSTCSSYAPLCKRTKCSKNIKHTNRKTKRANSMCNSYEPSTKRAKHRKQTSLKKIESSDYDSSEMESIQAMLNAFRPLPVTSKIKTNKDTCSKTVSDDSLQYKHIVIKPPSSGALHCTKLKECGEKDIINKILELENKKIIEENKNDGSTTEISFKLGIVMHVKTMKASTSPLETNFNDVVVGSKTTQNNGISPVHSLAPLNSSPSTGNKLLLNSSQNHLDLRRQRNTKMIETNSFHKARFPYSTVAQESLFSQLHRSTDTVTEVLLHPKLNSLENSSVSACNVQFKDDSGMALSHAPVFNSPEAHQYCVQTHQNTIVVQAEVHRTLSGQAVTRQLRSKVGRN